MIKRDELIKFIRETIGDDFLQKAEKIDEAANGIQILGSEGVERISLGVSANEEFLKKAAEKGSTFCIFHHGFDPRTHKSIYPLDSQKRLQVIFQNNITICGLHYSLDAHREIGNNALIIDKLGAKIIQPFFEEWGYTAEFSTPQNVHDLIKKCEELFNHEVFTSLEGPSEVTTIGVVSGAAIPHASELLEMEEKGVQLFITGESSESVPHKMKEAGINYFAGGHYATEVFGVQALGKKIKEHFQDKIEVEFVDVPNSL